MRNTEMEEAQEEEGTSQSKWQRNKVVGEKRGRGLHLLSEAPLLLLVATSRGDNKALRYVCPSQARKGSGVPFTSEFRLLLWQQQSGQCNGRGNKFIGRKQTDILEGRLKSGPISESGIGRELFHKTLHLFWESYFSRLEAASVLG